MAVSQHMVKNMSKAKEEMPIRKFMVFLKAELAELGSDGLLSIVFLSVWLSCWARVTTYISPVVSELRKRRPCRSKAMPTGLKQFSGQAELSALAKISTAAVLLSGLATGLPFSNGTTDNL